MVVVTLSTGLYVRTVVGRPGERRAAYLGYSLLLQLLIL